MRKNQKYHFMFLYDLECFKWASARFRPYELCGLTEEEIKIVEAATQ